MLVCSVQIISRLDSQSKLQMYRGHGGSILGSVNLFKIFRGISELWENTQTKSQMSLIFINLLKHHNFLTLSTEWFSNILCFIASGFRDNTIEGLFCWGQNSLVSFTVSNFAYCYG